MYASRSILRSVRTNQMRAAFFSSMLNNSKGIRPSFNNSLYNNKTTFHQVRTYYGQSPQVYDEATPANFGLVIVPQQTAYVVERLGKYSDTLTAGLHFLIPFIDRIAYVHNLKEVPLHVHEQTAITKDNVTILIDGVLYMRIIDSYKASYGIQNAKYAMIQIAQTTMRSELGKLSLDHTFVERETLNHNIVKAINIASEPWGVQCLRYEILDIKPPQNVKQAMELQAEAERKKRAAILESEGHQQSEINIASAERQAAILQAEGEAEAIRARALANANAIDTLAGAINKFGGKEAVTIRLAEQYVESFSKVAKASTTLLMPANVNDPANMIASALSVFNTVSKVQAAAIGSASSPSSTPASNPAQPSNQ